MPDRQTIFGVMTPDHLSVTLETADPLAKEATQLLYDMRAEALRTYSDVLDAAALLTNDPLAPRSAFLLARLGDQPVGCAALRPVDESAAEVRRMFVAAPVRRRGIARRLLTTLEQMAVEFGYHTLRLETGARQPEAIALYESHGFQRIPPYGCHVGESLSLCFEKKLNPCKTANSSK